MAGGRRSTQSLSEGTAARVVAAGCLPRGRRSTQSLQKGLRPGLSLLVPLAVFLVAGAAPRASQKGLRPALSLLVPLAVFLVAGAVPRASQKGLRPEPPRRGCGARCRRWYRWLSTILTHIQLHIILFTSPTHIISNHLNRSPSTVTRSASPSVCIFTHS